MGDMNKKTNSGRDFYLKKENNVVTIKEIVG